MKCRPDADAAFVMIPPRLRRVAMEHAIATIPAADAEAAIDHALGEVVTWSHGLSWGNRHRLEPMYYARRERGSMGARPRLRAGRAPGPHWDEYGRDSDGRIIVVRTPHTSSMSVEKFDVWLSREESVVFAPTLGEIVELRRYVWDGERMQACSELRRTPARHDQPEFRSYEAETFHYVQGRLDSVRSVAEPEVPRGPFEHYCTIERRPKRQPACVWRPVEAAEPPHLSELELDAAVERLTDGLAEAIPRLARTAAIDRPVYFVNLIDGRSPFQVQVSPATIDDRARILHRRPYRAFDIYVQFSSSGVKCDDDDWGLGQLVELGRDLDLELQRRRDDARGATIWRDLTKRLNERDWRDCFPITDDFVVVATPSNESPNAKAKEIPMMLDEQRYEALLEAETTRAEALAAEDPGPPPVKPHQALRALKTALKRAGVPLRLRNRTPLRVGDVWRGFLAFLEIPIAGLDPFQGEDAVLIEYGPDSYREDSFYLNLVRQLNRGELGMETIRIELAFPIGDALNAFGDENEWFMLPDLDEIRTQAPTMPGLAALLDADAQPTSLDVRRDPM